MWKLNNILLNNQWIKKNSQGKLDNYIVINENENKTCENLRDTEKAVLRGKFTAINAKACIKKQERFQINNLTL